MSSGSKTGAGFMGEGATLCSSLMRARFVYTVVGGDHMIAHQWYHNES